MIMEATSNRPYTEEVKMKTLSIMLLILTFVHGVVKADGDATAIVVAFILFSNVWGKDLTRTWLKYMSNLNGKR